MIRPIGARHEILDLETFSLQNGNWNSLEQMRFRCPDSSEIFFASTLARPYCSKKIFLDETENFFFQVRPKISSKKFFFVIFLKMSKFSKNPKISTKSKIFEKIMFLDSKSTLELFVRLPMIQACSTCAYNKLRASEDHPTTFHPLNRDFSDPDGPITIALTMELPYVTESKSENHRF